MSTCLRHRRCFTLGSGKVRRSGKGLFTGVRGRVVLRSPHGKLLRGFGLPWPWPSDRLGYRRVGRSAKQGTIDGRKTRQGRREGLLHLGVRGEAQEARGRAGGGRAVRDPGGRGKGLRARPSGVQRRARAGGGGGRDRVPAQVDQLLLLPLLILLLVSVYSTPAGRTRAGSPRSW